jgi:hypothetical protein
MGDMWRKFDHKVLIVQPPDEADAPAPSKAPIFSNRRSDARCALSSISSVSAVLPRYAINVILAPCCSLYKEKDTPFFVPAGELITRMDDATKRAPLLI